MKRILGIIMALLLMLGMTACAAQVVKPESEVIAFNDAVLEAKVREAMNKPKGDITAAEAERITELNLSNEWQQDMPDKIMIKDISALKYFVNLKELRINFNAVANISGLTHLQKLVLLELRGNAISDLSPLASLENLSVLNLQDNQVNDIKSLAGLKNLKEVWLGGNVITDYSPLKDVYQNLEQKDFDIISANDVPDEPIVISDPKLETALRNALSIKDRPITQRDAYQVQSLGLSQEANSDAAFSDIRALSYFVNLKELYLDGNKISDLSPLRNLTKLKVLTFEWNRQITDISALSGMKQLEKLSVKQNKIVDLSPLAGLTSIWELQLNSNQITDISPLAGLKGLKALFLSDNPISDYSSLKDIYPKLEAKDFELK